MNSVTCLVHLPEYLYIILTITITIYLVQFCIQIVRYLSNTTCGPQPNITIHSPLV